MLYGGCLDHNARAVINGLEEREGPFPRASIMVAVLYSMFYSPLIGSVSCNKNGAIINTSLAKIFDTSPSV